MEQASNPPDLFECTLCLDITHPKCCLDAPGKVTFIFIYVDYEASICPNFLNSLVEDKVLDKIVSATELRTTTATRIGGAGGAQRIYV
jgi:hypothetical protein